MNCPDCGGAMWDNTATKKTPKSPDYKCKNQQCGKAVWLEKKGASSEAAVPARAPRALGPLYNECLEFARACCVHHFGDIITPADIIAATATVFIQAVRDGAPIRTPKPAPAPKPVPAPAPPAPEPVYETMNDLPF